VMNTGLFRASVPTALDGEIARVKFDRLWLDVNMGDVEGRAIYYVGDWGPRLT